MMEHPTERVNEGEKKKALSWKAESLAKAAAAAAAAAERLRG